MRQTRTQFYITALLILICVTCFEHCKEKNALNLHGDLDNGGLQLQKNFEALVIK